MIFLIGIPIMFLAYLIYSSYVERKLNKFKHPCDQTSYNAEYWFSVICVCFVPGFNLILLWCIIEDIKDGQTIGMIKEIKQLKKQQEEKESKQKEEEQLNIYKKILNKFPLEIKNELDKSNDRINTLKKKDFHRIVLDNITKCQKELISSFENKENISNSNIEDMRNFIKNQNELLEEIELKYEEQKKAIDKKEDKMINENFDKANEILNTYKIDIKENRSSV